MFDRIKVDLTRHSIQVLRPTKMSTDEWAKQVAKKMKDRKRWTQDQYLHLKPEDGFFSTLIEKEVPPVTVRSIKKLDPVSIQWWVHKHRSYDNSDGFRPYADFTLASGRRFIIGRLGYNSQLSKLHVLLPRGKYLPCPSLGDACAIVRALDDIKYAPLLIGGKSERYAKSILTGELTY